ncbi:MAG: outer membrane beta-barrel protein [Gemmatimonadota bacterium]
MMRILSGAAVLGFTVLASANVAAQETSEMANKTPVQFGVLGGVSFPTSGFKDLVKTGWHAGALVNLGFANLPVGLRIDGQWHQFGLKPEVFGSAASGEHLRDLHGTADAVFNVGSGKAVKFYLLGGVGVYNFKTSGTGASSATKFGLNGGGGFKFNVGSLSPFVEARYHYVFLKGNDFSNNSSNPKFQMVPISVGLTF